MFADFAESSNESLDELQAVLDSKVDQGNNSKSHIKACTGEETLSNAFRKTSLEQGQPHSHDRASTTPFTRKGRATSDIDHQSRLDPGMVVRDPTSEPVRKRFVELCVNTGEYQRQLAEIDVTNLESDSQLFERIKEKYLEVRSFRVKYFLLKPIDVHFVQVSSVLHLNWPSPLMKSS